MVIDEENNYLQKGDNQYIYTHIRSEIIVRMKSSTGEKFQLGGLAGFSNQAIKPNSFPLF